jgi:hypothetical protein
VPGTPPVAGTVIRYRYLWKKDADQGQTEGEKDRPAALIVAKGPADGSCVVVAITHTEPDRDIPALEVPETERRRIGLDEERSWVILSEINEFIWPGPDLRTVPGKPDGSFEYGRLSKDFFTIVLGTIQTAIRSRRMGRVTRGRP